jgi:hypothetical protein
MRRVLAPVLALLAMVSSCGGDDGGSTSTTTFPEDQLTGSDGPAEVDLAALAVFDDAVDAVVGTVPAEAGTCAAAAAAALGEPLAPEGAPVAVQAEGDVWRLDLDGGLTWLVTPPGAPELAEPLLVVPVIGGSVVVGFARASGERIVARLDAGGLDQAVLVPAPAGAVEPACADIAVGAAGVLAVVAGEDGTPQLVRWDWKV